MPATYDKSGDDTVVIRSYPNAPDAYIALDTLRNNGIIAEVTGGLATLYTPVPAPAGGYDLTVFARDRQKALRILDARND